ncbi:MAG TPA: DUF58 domain-containing protein [Spirochaetota bacterium]|nr:DUF58 domain-containing protein [Spirochaetota bacterium]
MISINRAYLLSLVPAGIAAFALLRYPIFFIFFMLLFLGVYSVILIIVLYKTTIIRFEQPSGILYAGNPVKWSLSADNVFPVPSVKIKLKDRSIPRSLTTMSEGTITSYRNCRIESSSVFPSRGIYNLSHCEILLQDVFKIASCKFTYDAEQKIYIYPALYDTDNLFLAGRDIYRDEKDLLNGRENPEQISEIRGYVHGDSIKKIHWKQSARQDELQVKSFERCAGSSLVILADFNDTNNDFDPSEEEAIADITVSTAYKALKQGISTTVTCNNSLFFNNSYNHYHEFDFFYRSMLTVKSDGKTPFAQFVMDRISGLDRMTQVIAVTLKLDIQKQKAFDYIINRGNSFAVIYLQPQSNTEAPFYAINGHDIITPDRRIIL